MNSVAKLIADGLFHAGMRTLGLVDWQTFGQALNHPDKVQTSLLKQILARNGETDFGRRHQFGLIDSRETYRAAVPTAEYEQLRPLIDHQMETGQTTLTAQAPIHYARTSGTTGAAKLLPVTPDGLAALRRVQRLFAFAQFRGAHTFAGRILAIAGAAIEARTPTGVPIGSATGAVYAGMPRPIRRRYVVPPVVFTISDYDARDYLIALLGLAANDISALATANPSTLVRLQQVMRNHWDDLLRDLDSGRLNRRIDLNQEQQRTVEAVLRADPIRANALRRGIPAPEELHLRDVWPHLRSVVTWTGGSCGYALGALRPSLPSGAQVIEAGYHASECSGTVNVEPAMNRCVPALWATVFEFVEQRDWENGNRRFLSVGEVETGRSYYVFVTTHNGLYRYAMNDIVTVTGRVAATPILTFVQKGRGFTSITGEKLSESQALSAVSAAATDCGIGTPFFLLLADEAAATYRLYVETDRPAMVTKLAAAIDRGLQAANLEYAAKRDSGRLNPLVGRALQPGTGDAYRRNAILKGQRDAQFKIQHLQYQRDLDFDLTAHLINMVPR